MARGTGGRAWPRALGGRVAQWSGGGASIAQSAPDPRLAVVPASAALLVPYTEAHLVRPGDVRPAHRPQRHRGNRHHEQPGDDEAPSPSHAVVLRLVCRNRLGGVMAHTARHARLRRNAMTLSPTDGERGGNVTVSLSQSTRCRAPSRRQVEGARRGSNVWPPNHVLACARSRAQMRPTSLRLQLETHIDGRANADLPQRDGLSEEIAAPARAFHGHLIHSVTAVATTGPRIVVRVPRTACAELGDRDHLPHTRIELTGQRHRFLSGRLNRPSSGLVAILAKLRGEKLHANDVARSGLQGTAQAALELRDVVERHGNGFPDRIVSQHGARAQIVIPRLDLDV